MKPERLKEIERMYAPHTTHAIEINTMKAQLDCIDELIAEVKRLREVLTFYGHKYNHLPRPYVCPDGFYYGRDSVCQSEDRGQRARDALGGEG